MTTGWGLRASRLAATCGPSLCGHFHRGHDSRGFAILFARPRCWLAVPNSPPGAPGWPAR